MVNFFLIGAVGDFVTGALGLMAGLDTFVVVVGFFIFIHILF